MYPGKNNYIDLGHSFSASLEADPQMWTEKR